MASVTNALEKLGELEWYAVRPAELATGGVPISLFPPLVTFRYKGGNRSAYNRLLVAMRAYVGKVNWVVTGENEKNLCIMPDRVHRLLDQQTTVTDAINALLAADPSFVASAVEDFPHLVSHVQQSS